MAAFRFLYLIPHDELLLLVVDPPGEMVHAADAPGATLGARRLAEIDDARGVREAVARPPVLAAQALEAEDVGQERLRDPGAPFPELRAIEPADLMPGRNRAAVPWRERALPSGRAFDEREAEAVRIDQRQDLVAEPRLARAQAGAVSFQTRSPEAEAARRHLQTHLDGEPVAETRRCELGPGEEGEVRARMTFRVRVEEVVRARIVLIDALLDEAHAEHARVEVQVLLGRPGDGGDVMETADALHRVDPPGEESTCNADRLNALTAGSNMHVPMPVEPAELAVVVASLTKQAKLPMGS